jgi:hypothetical protein
MEEYYKFINECRLKSYNDNEIHKHHIIPRHMGGDDSMDNLIELSIEDHYTAHMILAECFDKGNPLRRSNFAAAILIKRGMNNPEKLLEYRESLKGKGNPNYGNNWTDEQKKIQSDKIIKMWSNPENLKKIMKPKLDSTKMGKHDKSGEKNPFYGKKHSKKSLEIMSEKRKGKKPGNIKKILIEGNIYEGLQAASNATGIKGTTIWHRIHSENRKYENYKYID